MPIYNTWSPSTDAISVVDPFLTSVLESIRKRSVLEVLYESGLRVIEPHAIGLNEKREVLLYAFQIDGLNEFGEPAGWQLFNVSRLLWIKPLGIAFSNTRPGYVRGNPGIIAGSPFEPNSVF